MERLRYVARAAGAGPVQLTQAAARALAGLGLTHQGVEESVTSMLAAFGA